MKWTLKLECIDEAGNFLSATVGHIERPALMSESDLGLTHDDGKFLIRRVQAEIAQDQVRAFISKIRPCPCCGRLAPSKNIGAGGSTRCLDICAFMRLASRPAFAGSRPPRLLWPSSFRIALRLS
jgi:hypothetical protein